MTPMRQMNMQTQTTLKCLLPTPLETRIVQALNLFTRQFIHLLLILLQLKLQCIWTVLMGSNPTECILFLFYFGAFTFACYTHATVDTVHTCTVGIISF